MIYNIKDGQEGRQSNQTFNGRGSQGTRKFKKMLRIKCTIKGNWRVDIMLETTFKP